MVLRREVEGEGAFWRAGELSVLTLMGCELQGPCMTGRLTEPHSWSLCIFLGVKQNSVSEAYIHKGRRIEGGEKMKVS